MNPSRLAIVVVASVASFGCNRVSQVPPSGFRLTLQEVAKDENARAALVIIQTAATGFLSVDEERGHSSIALPESSNRPIEVNVALMASRIAPRGEGDIHIQTLIRPQTANGTYAGGPSTYTLPRATKLVDHFTVTAKSGDYPLNTPIEIARFQGKPVTLTVGNATK